MSDSDIRSIEASVKPRRVVTLLAPRDGVMMHRGIAVGTAVDPSTELMIVADLSRVWVLAEVPEFGAAHCDLIRQYQQMSNIIILARDLGSGRVTLDDAGEASVHYELHERDKRSVLDGMKLGARIMQAAGARRVQTLHAENLYADFTGADSQKSLQEFDKEIDRRGIEPNRCVMFSAHQMGTCRMGSDPKTSVVDRFGECHEVKGLYLADGSIFPASAGINPMLPIMALAEQIASHLVGRKIK
jgi:choline dehydrogenase-like flavoprotein